MKKKYALTFAAVALAAASWSATIEKTLTFDEDDLTFTQEEWGETTYDLVTIKGGTPYNDLGKPQLPMVRYSISLPFGSEVTAVEVIASDTDEVSGSYYLLPGQVPMRAGNPLIIYAPDWPEPWEFTPPDEETYESEDYFPADILVDDGAGDTRGYLTTDFHIFPLQYKPADRELRLYTSVTVRVTYTPPEEPPAATRYEWTGVYDQWGEGLTRSVLNPDDIINNREPVNAVDVMAYGYDQDNGQNIPWVKPNDSSYYEYNTPDAVEGYSDPEDMEYPFKLVVITNDKWWKNETEYETQTGLLAALEPYREWRTRLGFPTKIVSVDTIVARVTGNDKQDKIRNFLKIAFERWGITAAFFVGDTQADTSLYSTVWGRYGVVPSRYVCYNPQEETHHIEASDYYYACLDGSWGPIPNNEYGYFGTPSEELILKPTISVGRMPVGGKATGAVATTEFNNWLDKLLTYEKMPPAAYLDDVLFLGSDFGCSDCKYLWEGAGGTGCFPGFSATHIYESTVGPGLENAEPEAVYPTYPEPHECLDALNAGPGLTVVATHGHPLGHYITTHGYNLNIYIEEFMVDRDVPAPYANNMVFATGLKQLTNGPRYGVLATNSCSTFRYTYRDDEDKECLGEEYLSLANGGGVAYLGSTESGYIPTARYLLEYIFDNLIGPTSAAEDDIYPLGLAHVLARGKFAIYQSPFWQDLYDHNVGGDPLMPVWTANPTALAMTYRYYVEGETYVVEAFIKDKDNNPLTGVTVNLWVDDLYYLTGETNETGKVRFKGLGAFENGKLTAWKHNYKPALADGVDVPG